MGSYDFRDGLPPRLPGASAPMGAFLRLSGKVLGNPDMPEISKRGVAALKANARRFAANVRPIIEEIMPAGATSP